MQFFSYRRQKKQADCQQSLERVNATQQCEIDRLEREVARLAQQMSPGSQQASPSPNPLADAYEQRAKNAEKEAEFAESRANRNEVILAQKMTDMNNLQSTLTHQSKELRQLERAYNQLRNHSQNLSRVSSPSLHTRPGSAPLFTGSALSFSGPATSFSSLSPSFSSPTHSFSGTSPLINGPTSSFSGRSPTALRRQVSLTTL
ncbi:uncharacterized protein LOC135476841 [Liolophura sinensis]|uniref:uncharacterized protein LOC135476841 n=1 Tax=Liolophura sinensis TaxID=3198878 RepID=UPI0031597781